MPVDRELVEQLVKQIIGQLEAKPDAEHILILGSRADAQQVTLPGSNGETRYYYSDEKYNPAKIDRFILPRLELNDMADLAQGRATSPLAGEIRGLLLGGNEIEILNYAFESFKESAPFALIELYSGYAETLKSFGLSPARQERKSMKLNKRVISEKDIEQLHQEGADCITVPAKSIVTSLAEEGAKKFNIEIQREERGA